MNGIFPSHIQYHLYMHHMVGTSNKQYELVSNDVKSFRLVDLLIITDCNYSWLKKNPSNKAE
jgi:hypothetical protein